MDKTDAMDLALDLAVLVAQYCVQNGSSPVKLKELLALRYIVTHAQQKKNINDEIVRLLEESYDTERLISRLKVVIS